MTALSGKRSHH